MVHFERHSKLPNKNIICLAAKIGWLPNKLQKIAYLELVARV